MKNELMEKSSNVTADLPAVRITREDIRKHFCPLATDQEVAMGLAIVKSLNLNPFLREVHFVKYDQKSKMAIIVGYEVFLKRADRTGKLDGWSAGINTAENYSWVKIWRKDWKEPFEWQVNLTEFNKKQSTWNQIPSFMGRKVAIAQGFRLAFPDELGGMPYTQEEHEVYDIDATPNCKPAVAMPKSLPAPESTKTEEKASMPENAEIAQNSPVETPKTGIYEPSAKLQALESLAKIAFHGKKQDWVNYLGTYGCESVTQLNDEQIVKMTKELNEKIKNAKK